MRQACPAERSQVRGTEGAKSPISRLEDPRRQVPLHPSCSLSYSKAPWETMNRPQNSGPDRVFCKAELQDGGFTGFFWHLEETHPKCPKGKANLH